MSQISYTQKIIFLFHVQVNGAKNLMCIEQQQSIMLVPGDFGPQQSSSGALTEAAKPQGTFPLSLHDCLTTNVSKLEIGQRSQPFLFFCSKLPQTTTVIISAWFVTRATHVIK